MTTHRGFWLKEALAAEGGLAPAASLQGDRRADICIVGGGFTGLWTAIHLKTLRPSLDVVLIERDICGGGASGRNGGFAMTWASKLSTIVKICGAQEGLRLLRASQDAVRTIGAFCRDNGIDAHYRPDGWLWTAADESQNDAWADIVEIHEKLGSDAFQALPPAEVQRRAASKGHIAGIFEPAVATVQPARLARGLRKAALARGVTIHENTPMTGWDKGASPRVRTANGSVIANKVVLSMGTWAAEMPEFRRTMVPVSADMIATAPMADRLREIGLNTGVAISDSSMLVSYYRTTLDGRIVFGKGGGKFGFAGQVGTNFDGPSRRATDVEAMFRRWYPALSNVPITETWRGPVERTSTGLPFFGRLPGNVVYGHGYTGNGVGPCYLGGRILASLALDLDDEWSATPLAKGPQGHFPPEPIRYVGAYMVRGAIKRKEAKEAAGGKAGPIDTYLAGLAPAGLTPLKKK
ncbi:MAG: FAD-dependent oxidoreductase [Alphaproteobacteria bacterium]